MKTPESTAPRALAGLLQPGARASAVWHSSLSTLLRRHQSMASASRAHVPGTEEQKPRVACPKSPRRTSPPSCSPSPTSVGPRARRDHRDAPEDGTGYIINGRKLWADQRRHRRRRFVVMTRWKAEGRKGGSVALSAGRHRGRHGRAPQRSSWACAASRTPSPG
jgi:hypothetical protein